MATKPIKSMATPKEPIRSTAKTNELIKSMATRKKPDDTKYTEEQIREQINVGSTYVGIEGVRHALLALAMLEYNRTVEVNRNEQAD